jgi:hypothetical protein
VHDSSAADASVAAGIAGSGARTNPLRQATAQQAERLRIDAVLAGSVPSAGQLQGWDPAAPRALELWRVETGEHALLARGHSDLAGDLIFPPILLPEDGFTLVVTPAGIAPNELDASEPRATSLRMPEPPSAVSRSRSGDSLIVRVTPREAHGEVLIADSAGQLLGRERVARHPASAARSFDIIVTPGASGSALWLAHRFSDGRQSTWQQVQFASQATGGLE